MATRTMASDRGISVFGVALLVALCACATSAGAQARKGAWAERAKTEQEEAKEALAEKQADEIRREREAAEREAGEGARADVKETVQDMIVPKAQPRKRPKPIVVDVEKALGGKGEPKREAPSLTLDEVLAKMESVRKGLKSITADVVRVVYVEPLDDTERWEGKIQFKLPRLLRMRLVRKATKDARRKEIIYIVGKKLAFEYRVHDQQAEGVPLKDVKKKIRDSNPLEYGLSGDVREWRKTYDLKLLPEEKVGGEETVALEMRPKGLAADETEGTITMWLSKATWLPRRIREVKNDGDIIETHTFSKMKRDVKIPDSVFEFEPGDDVDVIIHAPE